MYKRLSIFSLHSISILAAFFVFLIFGTCFSQTVIAQSEDVIQGADPQTDIFGIEEVGAQTKLGKRDLLSIVRNVINVMLGLLGIIVVSIFLYAGYLIMTSGGQEDKITQGKKMMMNATVGLLIILSSFAIVQFIFKLFGAETGNGGVGASGNPTIGSFAGAGSLGKIIKYHYPENNQKGVYRNSAIAITFKVPVDPGTIIANSNNTCWDSNGLPSTDCQLDQNGNIIDPYYGDCLPTPPGKTFDAVSQCDQLRTDSVQIFNTSNNNEDFKNNIFVTSTAQVNYNNQRLAYTFVFKPFHYLGSNSAEMPYEVRLLNGEIDQQTKKPKVGFFQRDVNSDAVQPINFSIAQQHYKWIFETSKEIDDKPPTVSFVFPKNHTTTTKDVIMGVLFSEAMNPITVEGIVNQSSLSTASATSQKNILFGYGDPATTGKPFPAGEWIMSNGYRTNEFFPTEPCGTNSCGQQKYCLQIVKPGGNADDPSYVRDLTLGLLTSDIAEGGLLFEAVPLTGITDMAGNALDGNKNNVPDGKPLGINSVLEKKGVDGSVSDECEGDNYCWSFVVQNDTDRVPPYVQRVTPFIDEENVDEIYAVNSIATILFSKLMTEKTFDDLDIQEYTNKTGLVTDQYGKEIKIENNQGNQVSLTYDALLSGEHILGKQIKTDIDTALSKERTKALIDPTSAFGRGLGVDLYYFVSATSTVQDKFQNCVYPGRGPQASQKGVDTTCEYEGGVATNCISVSDSDPALDTGCGLVEGSAGVAKGNLLACKQYFIDDINSGE